MKRLLCVLLVSPTILFAGVESVTIDSKSKQMLNPLLKFGSGNTVNATGATLIGFPTGTGNVISSGMPLLDQIAVWTDATHIKGVTTIKGGTTGQVLQKSSNTDYDYVWATVVNPTPTATATSTPSATATATATPTPIASTTPGGSTTQIQYNNANTFGGVSSLTYDGTIPATITLGQTAPFDPKLGLWLRNTTAATLNNSQSSPSIEFSGNAWNTNSNTSIPIDFRLQNYTSSAAITDSNLTLEYQISGGGWNTLMQFEAPTQVVFVSGDFGVSGISEAPTFLATLDYVNGVKLFPNATGPGNNLDVQTSIANNPTAINITPNGTYANAPAILSLFSTDYVSDATNYSQFAFIAKGSADTYHTIAALKGGSGVVHPINIGATNSLSTTQLVIGTDGGVSVGTGTQAGSTNLLVDGTITGRIVQKVTFVVDAGGVLTTGTKNPIKITHGGTLLGWTMMAKPSGSVTADIFRAADGAGLPVTSIVGAGTKPAISSNVENSSTSFTSWTSTTLTAKDNLAISLSGISTSTYTELTLYFQ